MQELFESEIETQCQFASISAQQVNDSLRSPTTGSSQMVWYWLQNLLMAAANLSKLLWGKNGATAAKRASLRSDLGLADADTFELRSRELRNDFEHFDERLTTKFANPATRTVFVGRNIGPPGMIHVEGMTQDDWFQHFDPSTATVSFWDRKVDLNKVMAEVSQIHAAVQARRAQT